MKTSCAGGRHNMPAPCKMTFDLLTFRSLDVRRLTTSDVWRASSLNASALSGWAI